MFDKEAEEYRSHNTNHYDWDDFSVDDGEAIEEAFQKGAEFGYNKANEWHYVKDGDLPKVNELILIKITGCLVLGWTNGTNWFNDSNNGTIIDRRMVIAWKEIVLPELKESEK